MDLYKNLIGEVGKSFTHKKDMWIEISSQIQNKNPKQCEQRFNTVLKRKRKGLKKLYTTRGKTKNSIQIKRTFKIDPGTKKYISNNGKTEYTFHQNDNNTKREFLTQKCYINKRTKEYTMQETLLFISAKKEEAKERRHKEKMEAINKMQIILQQVLESRQK